MIFSKNKKLWEDTFGCSDDASETSHMGTKPDEIKNISAQSGDSMRPKDRLPKSQIIEEKIVDAASHCNSSWKLIKETSNVESFLVSLQVLVDLKREQAALLGFSSEPYEVFLKESDPCLTIEDVENALTQRVSFLDCDEYSHSLLKQPVQVSSCVFPVNKQLYLIEMIAASFGFDLDFGQIRSGPFSGTLNCGYGDVRVSVCIDKHDPAKSLVGALHEIGHAILDQNNMPTLAGCRTRIESSAVVHEATAGFFENYLGRDRLFWEKWYPVLNDLFPEQLRQQTLNSWIDAISKPIFSHRRTDSSVQFRNVHYGMRIEIERKLINGDIQVKDICQLWNAEVLKIFGSIDIGGSWLEDPHWSLGMFGYYSTYAVANQLSLDFQSVFASGIHGNCFASANHLISFLTPLTLDLNNVTKRLREVEVL